MRYYNTRSKWRVWKNGPKCSSSELRRLQSLAVRKACPIFNPNKGRSQAPVSCSDQMVRRLHNYLSSAGVLDTHRLSEPVVLCSHKGCRQQQWHTDYDPAAITPGESVSMSVILALTDGTSLEVMDGQGRPRHISLKRGEVCLFDGDLPHAGSAYTMDNIRLFAYLDLIGGKPRRKNATYLVVRP